MTVDDACPLDGGDDGAAMGGAAPVDLQKLRRVFLLATLLPAAIVLADQVAIASGWHRQSTPWALYTLYVVQVAVLAGSVGRFIDSWFLRWVVLVWVLVLIDLRLACAFMDYANDPLMYAMVSSQLGLLVFVAMLAPGPWPWRLPSALVGGTLLAQLTLGVGSWRGAWPVVLVLQTVVAAVLCLGLLVLGFRLRAIGETNPHAQANLAEHGFHFSIKHILFWMLAAVPVLGLGQGIDLWFYDGFDLIGWLRLAYVAALLSLVPLLVICSVLAGRRIMVLVPVVAWCLASVGGVLAVTVTSDTWQVVPTRWRGGNWQGWVLAELTGIGAGWIAWTLLSACFLAGLLLLFRTAGYRLVRRKRDGSEATE